MATQTHLVSVTQSNPKGEDQGNLPKLLRTFADTVEELGSVEILDLVLSTGEINEYGVKPYFTLYYDDSETRVEQE